MKSYIRILLTVFIASAGLAPVSAEPVLEPASLPAPPAAFEQNLGQNDPSVRFVLRREAAAAALLDDHIVFGVRSGEGVTRAAMRWLGGNPNVRIEGLEQMVKTTSYFIGNDPSAWVTGVPSHNRVRYHQVYAGIDLDFFVVGRTLEYDFIVSPGADPAQIRLAFESEAGVVLAQDGSLRFAGEGGEIAHRKPLLYQLIDGQRRLVEGRFVAAAANEFQFETGAYDPSFALVIDPVVTGRAFRGNGRDSLKAAAAIDADTLVAVGCTDSFDLVPGTMSNTGINAVAFRIRGVSGLIPSFEITSELLAGGRDDDSFTDVPVSSNGKMYMGGVTESSDFPFGSPLGGKDMFLGEWTPGGPYVIGVRFGGPDDDVFGGFASYTFNGSPQYGAFDANGDATDEFFTFGSVGTNTDDQFVQVRTWNADSFGAQGELHILGTSSGADPELNALLWNSSLGGLFGVGTSTGDLSERAVGNGSDDRA